jgi:hypothetical protein
MLPVGDDEFVRTTFAIVNAAFGNSGGMTIKALVKSVD